MYWKWWNYQQLCMVRSIALCLQLLLSWLELSSHIFSFCPAATVMERVVTTRIVSEPTPGEYYSRGVHCYNIIISISIRFFLSLLTWHFFLFWSCSNGENACALETQELRGNIGDESWWDLLLVAYFINCTPSPVLETQQHSNANVLLIYSNGEKACCGRTAGK